MDTTQETREERLIEEGFASMPEEVQNFMLSDAFSILLQGIQKVLGISEEQRESLRHAAYRILLGLKNEEEVLNDFINSDMSEELAVKSLYAIHTELIDRAANITEFYTEGEEEVADLTSNPVSTAPSPADILATLGERLSKARVVAPTTRTHSVAPPQEGGIKSIDPYREMPEV